MKTKYLFICTLTLFLFAAKSSVAQKSITNAFYLSKVLHQLDNRNFFDFPIIRNDTSLKLIDRFITDTSFRWNKDTTSSNRIENYVNEKSINKMATLIKTNYTELVEKHLKDKADSIGDLLEYKRNELKKKKDQIKEEKKSIVSKWNSSSNISDTLDIDSFAKLHCLHCTDDDLFSNDTITIATTDTSTFRPALKNYSNLIDDRYKIDSTIVAYNTIITNLLNQILINREEEKERDKNRLEPKPYERNQVYGEDKNIYVSIANNSTTNSLASNNSFKIPDESAVIDALAIFVANRFKEELTLTFIDELKYQIRNQEEVKQLFSHTLASLDNLKGYKLPSIGDNIFLALAQDILNIDTALVHLKKLPANIVKTIQLVNDFTSELEKGKQFEGVINFIDNKLENDSSLFRKIIHTVRVLNDNFRSYDGKSYYMNYDDLMEMEPIEFEYFVTLLANHESFFRNFLIANDVTSPDNEKNINKIKNQLGNMLLALENFENTINKSEGKERNLEVGQSLVNLFREIDNVFVISTEQTKKDFEIVEHMLEIFRHKMKGDFKPVLGHVVEIIKLGFLSEKVSDNFDNLIGFYKDVAVIYKDLDSIYKNDTNDTLITAAMLSYIDTGMKSKGLSLDSNFFSKLRKGKITRTEIEKEISVLKKIYENYKSLDSISYQSFTDNPIQQSVTIYQFLDELNDLKIIDNSFVDSTRVGITAKLKTFFTKKESQYQVIEKLGRIGGFATDVLKTKNSTDLAKVFEAYASPINSYKIKRTTRHSLAINAFVGLFVGGEDNWTINDKFNFSFGVTVPVGLTYSWGGRKRFSKVCQRDEERPRTVFIGERKERLKIFTGWASSITFTLLDITAPFTYRFTQTEEEGLPKDIKFEQVFSPGLIFSFHFPRQPLCLNFGAQLTPKLTSFKDEDRTYNAIRYSVGIAFDVPLFQIAKRDSFK